MPTHGRIPRPKHVFPEIAAAYFITRQWGLRVERFFHERAGWYPIWTIGALSGTLGLMLTVLLFIFHDPPQAAGTPVSLVPNVTVPVVPPVEPAPEPTPAFQEILPSPLLPQERPRLGLTLQRLKMTAPWDATDRQELARSRPPRREAPSFGVRDPWTLSQRRTAAPARFEPYFLTTQQFPVSPVVVLATNTYDQLRPVAATRISGLRIEKVMTATAAVGEPYTYSIFVRNVSGDVIPSVEVRERISTLHRVSTVEPDAHVEADELVWHLNQIPAGGEQVIHITLLPDEMTDVRSETSLLAISRVGAAAHVVPGTLPPSVMPQPVMPELSPVVPDPVFSEVLPFVTPLDPPLMPELAPAEPEAPVINLAPELRLEVSQVGVLKRGDTLSLVFEVYNVGNAPAENVVINVELSPEFQHRFGKSVEHRIVRLDAGKSHKALLKAVALKEGAGQLSAELTMKGTPQEQADMAVPVQAIEDQQVQPAAGEQTTMKIEEGQTCWETGEHLPSDEPRLPASLARVDFRLLARQGTP